ncbi:MAG: PilN domain-containing protein [Gammaproteobacteria bacterium]|nr:PilN domain-containing protein [Gammaproteobacteria bacterium]
MKSSGLKSSFSLSSPLLHTTGNLWHWWIEELAGILPQSIRAVTRPDLERLLLQPNGVELIASRGTHESVEEIGRYPLTEAALPPALAKEVEQLAGRSREVILCLPADKILLKTLTLPLVTETNLREVLGFEMDRQTPFSLDQVYYDHLVSKRDSKANTITLKLLVTPRIYLDELLAKLSDIGFQPHQVSIQLNNSSNQIQNINLLPQQARQNTRGSSHQLNLVLALVAVLLLAGTIALPLINKKQVINTLQTRVELATSKEKIVQRLREQVEQLSTGSDFLVKKKLLTPMALEIIDELTRILPDDSWIYNLTIKDKEIQIQGFSTAAASLIPLIESSERLQNPRFRSSVTTSQGSDSEKFHLSAEVTGG